MQTSGILHKLKFHAPSMDSRSPFRVCPKGVLFTCGFRMEKYDEKPCGSISSWLSQGLVCNSLIYIMRCSSARIFAVLPQKSCTFPPSIKILGEKNTVYKVCKPIKKADKDVFIVPHSMAVGNQPQERLIRQTLHSLPISALLPYSRSNSSSAIWMALVAAPLRIWSPQHHRHRPASSVRSGRTLPTNTRS